MTQAYTAHETAIVNDAAEIGDGTKIWHFSHIREGASIGRNCSIGQNVYVDKNVEIGNGVKIQNNVSIYQGVRLEDDVFCGPSMVFTNVNKPRSSHPTDASDYGQTLVKQGATIGANATIICGNDLGRWSFVGAGGVVTDSLVDYGLYVGNPVRQTGWACPCGALHKKVLIESTWNCAECERTFQLDDDESLVEL